jgi:hypothetical protein
MGAQILIPGRKQNPVMSLIPVAATAVGSYYGGPVGGLAAGKVAASATKQNAPAQPINSVSEVKPAQAPMMGGGGGGTSMQSSLSSDDAHNDIRQAYSALDYVPKDLAEHYRPLLEDALKLSKRQRGDYVGDMA